MGDFTLHFAPLRTQHEHSAFAARRILLLSLFIGSPAPLSGCDDSKTSGTQVPENPAAEAHRKAKGEVVQRRPTEEMAKGSG